MGEHDASMLETIKFHRAFKLTQQTSETPRVPPPEIGLARIQMLTEEVAELAHALGKRDLVGVLDGLSDIQVFLDGTYLACGLQYLKRQALHEVFLSNMSKLDEHGEPILDASGRVVKGPNYRPPDLAQFLRRS